MTEVQGFLFPRSATGKSSMIPPPPWHYCGDVLSVEYRTDPERVAELLPTPLELDDEDPGRVAVAFLDLQSCSDSFEELLDPVCSQYRECLLVVRVKYQGQRYTRCIYIWVNQDFAMVRGYHQGYPKKLGSVYLTRPVTMGKAGPRLAPGGRLGASLAAGDRRLIETRFTITGKSDTAGILFSLPGLHHRWMPAVESDGTQSMDELISVGGYDFESSEIWTGDVELNMFDSPTEEFTRLAPREILGGYYRSVAFSWRQGKTLERRLPAS